MLTDKKMFKRAYASNQTSIWRKWLLTLLLLMLFPPIPGTSAATSEKSVSKKHGVPVRHIYIDPAYGGRERGPQFGQHLYGKDLTLRLASKLGTALSDAGFIIQLSRNTDHFLSLENRPFIAKSKGADIYLSIKVTRKQEDRLTLLIGPPPKKAFTDEQTESKKLSEMQGDLDRIFRDLVIADRYESSVQLAQRLKEALGSERSMKGVQVLRVRDYILMNTDMPTVIIDIAASNMLAKKLSEDSVEQERLLRAICDGVKRYAEDRDAPSESI